MAAIMIPEFLARRFIIDGLRVVDVDRLYVGLLPLAGSAINYVSIYDTPHFLFVRHILHGAPVQPISEYVDYSHYITVHSHPCTEQHFRELITSIVRNGYDKTNKPIMVFRSWRRLWSPTRWDVADGFHRLAILAAMGERSIQVVTLQQRKNIFQRVADRIIRSAR